jgi:mannose-6-phosphate isomerase-like protein (cupin superfamily)
MHKVNIADKLALFTEQWSPKVVGAVDDYEIKLVKLQGDFVWHAHEDDDEMFLVVAGQMTIRLRDGAVDLAPGEFFVVPKGVEHQPTAAEECQVLLFERKGVVNTGQVADARTVREPERL